MPLESLAPGLGAPFGPLPPPSTFVWAGVSGVDDVGVEVWLEFAEEFDDELPVGVDGEDVRVNVTTDVDTDVVVCLFESIPTIVVSEVDTEMTADRLELLCPATRGRATTLST